MNIKERERLIFPFVPLLLHKNKVISDFREKAYFFNIFFDSQCTIFANNSTVPDIQSYETNSRLSSLGFKDDDIKLIRSLNIHKAHDHDDISILILSICDSAITKPLSIIQKIS